MKLEKIFVDKRFEDCDETDVIIVSGILFKAITDKMAEAFNENNEEARKKAYYDYIAIEMKHGIHALLPEDLRKDFFHGSMSREDVWKVVNSYLTTLNKRQKNIVESYIKYMLKR